MGHTVYRIRKHRDRKRLLRKNLELMIKQNCEMFEFEIRHPKKIEIIKNIKYIMLNWLYYVISSFV